MPVDAHAYLMTSRIFMGDTLGFHILFALLGVGLPLLASFFEFLGVYFNDDDYYRMAKRMGYAMAVLFITGAISGTIVSMQINLLWPHFMGFANKIIGLPFVLEGFAFTIEAVFLGVYLFSWDRLDKWTHWWCSVPLVIGSTGSALLITMVNSFMNAPTGFSIYGDQPVNIHPWQAMFNAAFPYEALHSIPAYYLTATFAIAGIMAFLLHKPSVRRDAERSRYYKKIMTTLLAVAFFFACVVGIMGDLSGKYIAQNEPIKLAASESIYQTQANAPLRLGGYADDNELHYAINIPGLLSWLLYGDTHAVVQGLNSFDPSMWPPLVVHYFLDIMVLIGMFLGAVPLVYFGLYKYKKSLAFSYPVLWFIMIGGGLAFVAVEMGWMLTEIGRQPYIIRGVMTTAQAVTSAQSVPFFASLFPVFYLVLFVTTGWLLLSHYRKPMASKAH